MATAIILAWPALSALDRQVPRYAIYPTLSLAWALAALAILCRLLSPGSGPRAHAAAAAILLINAIGLFGLPILSGTRHAGADLGPIRYLQRHLALGRFYSMFLFEPNYGSYFGLASLNWNVVPIPRDLAARIRRDLDPDIDISNLFGGQLQRIGPEVPNQSSEQATATTAIARLEALGVDHLVVPTGFDPLEEAIGPQAAPGPHIPRNLASGTRVAAAMPAGLTGDATLLAAGPVIGTYAGHPRGRVDISVCVRTRCASGHGDLADAVDNRPLWLRLDHPINTAPGDQITYQLQVGALAAPAALWMLPMPDANGAPTTAPFLLLRTRVRQPHLDRVYRDNTFDILRLPNPAPYFGTQTGHCVLHPLSRRQLHADCTAPDRLVRRELFYPGWTATLNRRRFVPDRFDNTFQSLPLPAGHSRIRFFYAPPHISWAWAAMLLGLLILAAGALSRRLRPPPALPSERMTRPPPAPV